MTKSLKKQEKTNPFDYIRALSESRDGSCEVFDADPRGYVPFLTTKAFAFGLDTIFVSKMINRNGDGVSLPPRSHFQYFQYLVPKKRRYTRWGPKDKSQILSKSPYYNALQAVYGYSHDKVQEALRILSNEELEAIQVYHSEVEAYSNGKL